MAQGTRGLTDPAEGLDRGGVQTGQKPTRMGFRGWWLNTETRKRTQGTGDMDTASATPL